MSESVLTIEEAARNLPELVKRLHARGDVAVLVESGHPVARIVPMPAEQKDVVGLIAFLRQWLIEHPEPDETLAADIDEGRE